MTTKVDILGDLSIHGSLIFLKDEASFPADASVGTMVLKGSNLYAYIQVGDFTTWYPFNSKTRSYIHTQALPSSSWTVNHNLGSSDVWYQAYLDTGAPIFAGRTIVDSNTFILNLSTEITGTVVVVAPDTVDVPTVKAQSLTVSDGTGVTTTIDSSGIRVNGTFVATTANIGTYVTNAVDTAIGNLADVASSGDYDDLINTPSLFSGAYADLSGKPTLFSGSYTDLSNKPSLFSGSYADLSNKPTTLSGYGITDAVNTSALGAVNGVATLDGSGKVPSSQLPSFVDDVVEYVSLAGFPETGETGKIYVSKDTNKTYRWTGSAYIEVSSGISSFNELSDKPTTLSGYGITDAATSDSPTFTGIMVNNASVRSEINNISSGMTIDCSLGNYFTKTLNGDATLAFSNVPSGVAYSCTLRVIHTSGTLSWPASIYWPNNQSLPSLSSGKTHLFVFVTDDGGTKWRAAALTNYNA